MSSEAESGERSSSSRSRSCPYVWAEKSPFVCGRFNSAIADRIAASCSSHRAVASSADGDILFDFSELFHDVCLKVGASHRLCKRTGVLRQTACEWRKRWLMGKIYNLPVSECQA